MSSSLNIGTTGLSASEKQMDVIGNNLANASTVGFKAADTYFASMLSQSLSGSGGSASVGQGVGVAAVSTSFAQGTFETTGNVTDVAIDGNGFFITKDNEGNALYTRAGGFHLSNTGVLTDISKYSVQGHMYDADGVLETQTMTDLNLQNALSKPSETTYFGVGMTLDSTTSGGETFNSSQVVYDSQGATHNLNTVFTKMEDSAYWGVQTTLDGDAATSQTYSGLHFDANGAIDTVYSDRAVAGVTATSVAGTVASNTINNQPNLYKATTASIVLEYTAATTSWAVSGVSNGGYANIAVTNPDATHVGVDLDGLGGADITFTISAPGAGSWLDNDTFKFDISATDVAKANSTVRFYDGTTVTSLPNSSTIGDNGDVTWNLAGLTNHEAAKIASFATTSRISSLENDGYAPGILTSLAIGKDGIVEGVFSNGQRQKLARMLLADFSNMQGLNKVGSYFIETAESGPPVNNKPGSGGLGELRSNSLEMSNTDTAKEFIKMITAQRAYQSSAKIIATADQMLQTLMNVKQ